MSCYLIYTDKDGFGRWNFSKVITYFSNLFQLHEFYVVSNNKLKKSAVFVKLSTHPYDDVM